MSGYYTVELTGKSVLQLLEQVQKAKEWCSEQDPIVEITGNDGSYCHDNISNVENGIKTDLGAYITDKLLKPGKMIKTGGDCNFYIIDDLFDKPEYSDDDLVEKTKYHDYPYPKKRRSKPTNYTAPKKKRKKH